jgi:hypothetical protein
MPATIHQFSRNLRTTALLFALCAPLAAGCAPVIAAEDPVPFALETVNGQPLPALLDGSEVRTMEVVNAALVLRQGLDRGGRADATTVFRITDAGQQPVQDTVRTQGSYVRSGDEVRVEFPGGAFHRLRVEDGGATLRTVAAGYGDAPHGGAATGVLHIHVFRRGVLIGGD